MGRVRAFQLSEREQSAIARAYTADERAMAAALQRAVEMSADLELDTWTDLDRAVATTLGKAIFLGQRKRVPEVTAFGLAIGAALDAVRYRLVKARDAQPATPGEAAAAEYARQALDPAATIDWERVAAAARSARP